MAPPPTLLSPPPTVHITPEPLTAASFAPFGTVISAPDPFPTATPPRTAEELASISSSLGSINLYTTNNINNNPKNELFEPAPPVLANQGSAIKISPISPFTNYYDGNTRESAVQAQAPSGRRGQARMSLFSCFPRKLRSFNKQGSPSQVQKTQLNSNYNPDVQSLLDDYVGEIDNGTNIGNNNNNNNSGNDVMESVFDVTILERHPFTSQTFIPIGLNHDDHHKGSASSVFLVIVAPTLYGQRAAISGLASGDTAVQGEGVIRNPPDLDHIRAFVARGDQAVTYAAGTWHAPMVVLGPRRVDFVVTQFANGVADEDCQEVGFGEGVVVGVDGEHLRGLVAAGRGGGGWKAKL